MTKTFSPSHFFWGSRDQGYLFQRRIYIGNMLPICVSYGILNVCSEPFVMALNVRAA